MRGISDEAKVGLMILIKRGGNTDDDRVHLLDMGVVGGGGKALGIGLLNLFRADAIDVRLALRQSVDFALVDIEAGHGKFLFGKQQG